jgi:hypothetical protein
LPVPGAPRTEKAGGCDLNPAAKGQKSVIPNGGPAFGDTGLEETKKKSTDLLFLDFGRDVNRSPDYLRTHLEKSLNSLEN